MRLRKLLKGSKHRLAFLLYLKRTFMNIQERVQELFNRFNVNLTVSEERTDMAEATLENGTVIYTDAESFEEGAEAYIINDEGEQIALPPGDYELADGAVLSIVEGGKIGGVKPSEGKGEGKGGDGKGVSPKKVTKPEAPAAEAPAAPPAKVKPPPKDPAPIKKSAQTPTEMEETKEEFVDSPVTREMVEEMIREAIASLMSDTEEEEEMESPKEADKEEMSLVDPEAPSAAPEAVEEPKKAPKKAKKEEAPAEKDEFSLMKAELEALRTELASVQKQAATKGLPRMAPTPKVEQIDLKSLTTEERVRALAKQFSK